jgi:hypothetical protein
MIDRIIRKIKANDHVDKCYGTNYISISEGRLTEILNRFLNSSVKERK